ncbi:MAG: hypothetical protein HY033_08270 [Ignavibacteriae bacterium]|nr:hypothetical protein [Ignavibacteria bacterium]MBI3364888.1 hypothetical protein [Ignavibacteriota bacterium]
MKSRFQFYMILSVVALFLLGFSGCYTQLGTTREEGQDQYGSAQPDNDSSSYGEGYNSGEYRDRGSSGYFDDEWDGWHRRARLGFSYYTPSYYWPSYAFNAAYSDPWLYDCYWSYDPWICGTSYYGSSYYGYPSYGYSPYYYSPFYSYYPPVYYRHANASPVHRGSRDFGSTRGGESTRGGTDVRAGGGYYEPDRGGYNLPGVSRIDRNTPGGVSNTNTSNPRGNSREIGSQRSSSPRSNERPSSGRSPDVRAWGSRGGATRGDAARQPNSGEGNPSFTPPPASYVPPRRGNNNGGSHGEPKKHEPSRGSRDSGSTRGGNSQPSYSPPPPPQQQSSPPPSSAPANTGSRGGNTRSGRRP